MGGWALFIADVGINTCVVLTSFYKPRAGGRGVSLIYDYIYIIIINPYPFWLKPSRIRPPPNFFRQRAMLGAAIPLVAAGELLLGDAAARGVFAAQPLGVLALFVTSVVALVALAARTSCCRPPRGNPTVVLLPSGARVTVNHG